jgi:hypothetical protein
VCQVLELLVSIGCGYTETGCRLFEDLDHNSKDVQGFFLKNPFWETLQKRVSPKTYKGVLSSPALGTEGRVELKQKQVEQVQCQSIGDRHTL